MKMSRTAAMISLVIFLFKGCEALTISCPTVIGNVAPCISFLKSNSKFPSDECCNGAKKLNDDADSQTNRKAICDCLKEGLTTVGDYDPNRIPLVSKDCGLSITLPPIDQKTDCNLM